MNSAAIAAMSAAGGGRSDEARSVRLGSEVKGRRFGHFGIKTATHGLKSSSLNHFTWVQIASKAATTAVTVVRRRCGSGGDGIKTRTQSSSRPEVSFFAVARDTRRCESKDVFLPLLDYSEVCRVAAVGAAEGRRCSLLRFLWKKQRLYVQWKLEDVRD